MQHSREIMEKKIKALIVDDEQGSRQVLKNLLEEYCPDVEVLGLAKSAAEGIKLIQKLKPELVFLDIAMPQGDGFEMLDNIETIDFGLIFTTAYDAYAVQAFEYSAVYYLLKPINILRLQKAVAQFRTRRQEMASRRLEVLKENMSGQNRKLALPTAEGLQFVEVVRIVRCMADGSYTHFFLQGGERIMVSKTLKHFAGILPEQHFFRVHHAHLINLAHIQKYLKGKGGYVLMSDGSEVEVSIRKKEAFLKRIG